MAERCEVDLHNLKSYNRKQEKGTKRLCEPCLFDKTEQDVSAFCTVCTEFLCRYCARDHKKNKVTRNHCVLEGQDVPNDSKTFKMMKKITSCSKHPDVFVTYKCEDHDDYICITCLAVEHRKCENVSEICAIDNKQVSDDSVSQLQQKRRELRQWTTSIKSLKEETVKSLLSEQNRIHNEREQFVNSIIQQLRNMNERSTVEMERLVLKEVANIKESVIKLNEAEAEQNAENDLLDITLRYGNKTETTVVCSLLLKKTELLETEYKEHRNVKHVQLQFEQNEALKQINSIGNIKTVSVDAHAADLRRKEMQIEKSSDEVVSSNESTKCKHNHEPKNSLEMKHQEATEHLSLMQRPINWANSYPVRNKTDRQTCSVRGSVLLPNGQIVIIDSSNRKIKVFHSNFSFASEFRLEETPIDICNLEQRNVALLFDNKKCIKIYIIDTNKVLYERSQMTGLYGLSIAHYEYWDALVLFSEERRGTMSSGSHLEIQIRNLSHGRGKRSISLHNLLEKDYFDTYNVYCANKHELYITHNGKVRCFEIISMSSSLELKEKWFYKVALDGISYVTTDSEGNIYVCGKASKNVHQINGKNLWQNRLVVPSIVAPTTVNVNSRKGEIVVCCENDDFFHVYKFMSW